jgi:hypothetical protein
MTGVYGPYNLGGSTIGHALGADGDGSFRRPLGAQGKRPRSDETEQGSGDL